MRKTSIKYISRVLQKNLVLCTLLSCFNLSGQHDLSLQISTENAVLSQGETAVFTLTVFNENQTNIEDLSIRVAGFAGAEGINVSVPAGTSFSEVSGIWSVQEALQAGTDSLSLLLEYENVPEGVLFITAEIIEMEGHDLNSVPGNMNYAEDDLATACVSVPIMLMSGDSVFLTAPNVPLDDAGHRWLRTTDAGTNLVSNTADYVITQAGAYRYENTLAACVAGTCCDIIVEEVIPPSETASIGGTVFFECNDGGAGVRETGEAGVAGLTVNLQGTVDATGANLSLETLTTQGGQYSFENVPEGTYQVLFNAEQLSGNWNFSPQDTGTDDSIDSDVNAAGLTASLSLTGQDINNTDIGLIDMTPPEFTFVPADITIDCSENIPQEQATASDFLGLSSLTFSDAALPGTGCTSEIITRTWTATDLCGNTTQATQVLTITDSQAPVITPLHPLLQNLNSGDEITVDCNTPFVLTETDVAVTDDCGSEVSVEVVEEEILFGNCLEDGYVVWMHCYFSALDACGNASEFHVYIRVTDNTAPEFVNMPEAQINLSCEEEIPPAPMLTATDNCSNPNALQIELSETDELLSACERRITRTWTVSDACENTNTTEQVINITDTEAPSSSTLAEDLEVDCSAVPQPLVPVFTDNCGTVEEVIYNEEQVGNGCNYQLVRTWIATDQCGNQSELSRVLTITDAEAPQLSGVPEDVTIMLAEGDQIPQAAPVSATDNCTDDLEVFLTEEQTGTACSYQIVRTWTVLDVCGNESSASQTLFVEDALEEISLSLSPDSCSTSTGTAVLQPAVYNYEWSTGATGNVQENLGVGDYSVTVSNSNGCTEVLSLSIENDCPCIDFSVASQIVDASCGDSNGTALLQPTGDPAGYTYLWVPALGTSNATGNERTELPAGDYVVFVFFMGDTECEEKVEFTINNIETDCTDSQPLTGEIIESEEERVAYDCEGGLPSFCLPFSPQELQTRYELSLNGTELAYDNLAACDFYTIFTYNFYNSDFLPPFTMEWQLNGEIHTAEITEYEDIPLFLNTWDTTGTWVFDWENHLLSTTNETDNSYGTLGFLNSETGISAELSANESERAASMSITLGPGLNTLQITDTEENIFDLLSVQTNCVTTEYIEGTLSVSEEMETCLSAEELPGDIVSIENYCADESAGHAAFTTEGSELCFTCTGLSEGTAEACFVMCDDLGWCDTTLVRLHVVSESAQEGVFVFSGFSPNGDGVNDAFTILGLDNYPGSELTVFNRWGQRVLKTKDYAGDWEGTHKGRNLPDATYFYILKYEDKIIAEGYMQLMR